MPRIPRDLSGRELCKLLERLGYVVTRQQGSHIRIDATNPNGSHRLTIPNHDSIKIGTLNSILTDVAGAIGITKSELADRLFHN
jgi:predicted RNA binding protein YcfA (HicA-like mRNA interferase family)